MINMNKLSKKIPSFNLRKNKSLKYIIGGNTIEENKRKLKVKKKTTRKCSPCFSNKWLCCNHILNTSTFQSSQTKETFNIYHHVNCKSKYVIYLLQCNLCNCQYIGKSETPFNIRLNNHRKDVSSINAIPACKHFNKPAHNFNTHAKFTIIEKLEKTVNVNKETLTKRLKNWDNFWTKRLKTLTPNGLNQELNWLAQDYAAFSSKFKLYLHIGNTDLILRHLLGLKHSKLLLKYSWRQIFMTSNILHLYLLYLLIICKFSWKRPRPKLVENNCLFTSFYPF